MSPAIILPPIFPLRLPASLHKNHDDLHLSPRFRAQPPHHQNQTHTPRRWPSLIRIFFPTKTGTKQACLFRDSYEPLTSTGLSIYGLSGDSPKSNTTFKSKQNLPYPLLCDPAYTLIKALGLAKPGNAKGTVRGVFVVDKAGKVLAAEPGGPDATVEVVRKLVAGKGGDPKKVEDAGEKEKDEKKGEDAAKVDGEAEK